MLWLLTIVLGMVWIATVRAWSLLGIGLGERWWAGAILVVGSAALIAIQDRMILRDPVQAAKTRAAFDELRDLLPIDAREGAWWAALSVSAGVCEELLFRGFLMKLLDAALGGWAAVLLSSVMFGLNHVYQGAPGVLKTSLFGLAMAGAYEPTGALWAPVLEPVMIIPISGRLGRSISGSWMRTEILPSLMDENSRLSARLGLCSGRAPPSDRAP